MGNKFVELFTRVKKIKNFNKKFDKFFEMKNTRLCSESGLKRK